MLKPVDIAVLGCLVHSDLSGDWTQGDVARKLGVAQSTVHHALRALREGGLVRGREPVRQAVFDLMVYAVRYVYPARLGAAARGLATAHAGPGLVGALAVAEPYVWPLEGGGGVGPGVEPLHGSIPAAASRDSKLHELFALVDVFRLGRVRERRLAEESLRSILGLEVPS